MNLEGERTATRKPPGGECSNIFGEAEIVVKHSVKPNPSFQSSIFSDSVASEQFPKPQSVCRPANDATLSTIFEDENKGKRNVLKRLLLQNRSSLFCGLTLPARRVKSVSNSFKCDRKPSREKKFLDFKRHLDTFDHSVFVSNSCDVNLRLVPPVVLPSYSKITPLKFSHPLVSNDQSLKKVSGSPDINKNMPLKNICRSTTHYLSTELHVGLVGNPETLLHLNPITSSRRKNALTHMSPTNSSYEVKNGVASRNSEGIFTFNCTRDNFQEKEKAPAICKLRSYLPVLTPSGAPERNSEFKKSTVVSEAVLLDFEQDPHPEKPSISDESSSTRQNSTKNTPKHSPAKLLSLKVLSETSLHLFRDECKENCDVTVSNIEMPQFQEPKSCVAFGHKHVSAGDLVHENGGKKFSLHKKDNQHLVTNLKINDATTNDFVDRNNSQNPSLKKVIINDTQKHISTKLISLKMSPGSCKRPTEKFTNQHFQKLKNRSYLFDHKNESGGGISKKVNSVKKPKSALYSHENRVLGNNSSKNKSAMHGSENSSSQRKYLKTILVNETYVRTPSKKLINLKLSSKRHRLGSDVIPASTSAFSSKDNFSIDSNAPKDSARNLYCQENKVKLSNQHTSASKTFTIVASDRHADHLSSGKHFITKVKTNTSGKPFALKISSHELWKSKIVAPASEKSEKLSLSKTIHGVEKRSGIQQKDTSTFVKSPFLDSLDQKHANFQSHQASLNNLPNSSDSFSGKVDKSLRRPDISVSLQSMKETENEKRFSVGYPASQALALKKSISSHHQSKLLSVKVHPSIDLESVNKFQSSRCGVEVTSSGTKVVSPQQNLPCKSNISCHDDQVVAEVNKKPVNGNGNSLVHKENNLLTLDSTKPVSFPSVYVKENSKSNVEESKSTDAVSSSSVIDEGLKTDEALSVRSPQSFALRSSTDLSRNIKLFSVEVSPSIRSNSLPNFLNSHCNQEVFTVNSNKSLPLQKVLSKANVKSKSDNDIDFSAKSEQKPMVKVKSNYSEDFGSGVLSQQIFLKLYHQKDCNFQGYTKAPSGEAKLSQHLRAVFKDVKNQNFIGLTPKSVKESERDEKFSSQNPTSHELSLNRSDKPLSINKLFSIRASDSVYSDSMNESQAFNCDDVKAFFDSSNSLLAQRKVMSNPIGKINDGQSSVNRSKMNGISVTDSDEILSVKHSASRVFAFKHSNAPSQNKKVFSTNVSPSPYFDSLDEFKKSSCHVEAFSDNLSSFLLQQKTLIIPEINADDPELKKKYSVDSYLHNGDSPKSALLQESFQNTDKKSKTEIGVSSSSTAIEDTEKDKPISADYSKSQEFASKSSDIPPRNKKLLSVQVSPAFRNSASKLNTSPCDEEASASSAFPSKKDLGKFKIRGEDRYVSAVANQASLTNKSGSSHAESDKIGASDSHLLKLKSSTGYESKKRNNNGIENPENDKLDSVNHPSSHAFAVKGSDTSHDGKLLSLSVFSSACTGSGNKLQKLPCDSEVSADRSCSSPLRQKISIKSEMSANETSEHLAVLRESAMHKDSSFFSKIKGLPVPDPLQRPPSANGALVFLESSHKNKGNSTKKTQSVIPFSKLIQDPENNQSLSGSAQASPAQNNLSKSSSDIPLQNKKLLSVQVSPTCRNSVNELKESSRDEEVSASSTLPSQENARGLQTSSEDRYVNADASQTSVTNKDSSSHSESHKIGASDSLKLQSSTASSLLVKKSIENNKDGRKKTNHFDIENLKKDRLDSADYPPSHTFAIKNSDTFHDGKVLSVSVFSSTRPGSGNKVQKLPCDSEVSPKRSCSSPLRQRVLSKPKMSADESPKTLEVMQKPVMYEDVSFHSKVESLRVTDPPEQPPSANVESNFVESTHKSNDDPTAKTHSIIPFLKSMHYPESNKSLSGSARAFESSDIPLQNEKLLSAQVSPAWRNSVNELKKPSSVVEVSATSTLPSQNNLSKSKISVQNRFALAEENQLSVTNKDSSSYAESKRIGASDLLKHKSLTASTVVAKKSIEIYDDKSKKTDQVGIENSESDKLDCVNFPSSHTFAIKNSDTSHDGKVLSVSVFSSTRPGFWNKLQKLPCDADVSTDRSCSSPLQQKVLSKSEVSANESPKKLEVMGEPVMYKDYSCHSRIKTRRVTDPPEHQPSSDVALVIVESSHKSKGDPTKKTQSIIPISKSLQDLENDKSLTGSAQAWKGSSMSSKRFFSSVSSSIRPDFEDKCRNSSNMEGFNASPNSFSTRPAVSSKFSVISDDGHDNEKMIFSVPATSRLETDPDESRKTHFVTSNSIDDPQEDELYVASPELQGFDLNRSDILFRNSKVFSISVFSCPEANKCTKSTCRNKVYSSTSKTSSAQQQVLCPSIIGNGNDRVTTAEIKRKNISGNDISFYTKDSEPSLSDPDRVKTGSVDTEKAGLITSPKSVEVLKKDETHSVRRPASQTVALENPNIPSQDRLFSVCVSPPMCPEPVHELQESQCGVEMFYNNSASLPQGKIVSEAWRSSDGSIIVSHVELDKDRSFLAKDEENSWVADTSKSSRSVSSSLIRKHQENDEGIAKNTDLTNSFVESAKDSEKEKGLSAQSQASEKVSLNSSNSKSELPSLTVSRSRNLDPANKLPKSSCDVQVFRRNSNFLPEQTVSKSTVIIDDGHGNVKVKQQAVINRDDSYEGEDPKRVDPTKSASSVSVADSLKMSSEIKKTELIKSSKHGVDSEKKVKLFVKHPALQAQTSSEVDTPSQNNRHSVDKAVSDVNDSTICADNNAKVKERLMNKDNSMRVADPHKLSSSRVTTLVRKSNDAKFQKSDPINPSLKLVEEKEEMLLDKLSQSQSFVLNSSDSFQNHKLFAFSLFPALCPYHPNQLQKRWSVEVFYNNSESLQPQQQMPTRSKVSGDDGRFVAEINQKPVMDKDVTLSVNENSREEEPPQFRPSEFVIVNHCRADNISESKKTDGNALFTSLHVCKKDKTLIVKPSTMQGSVVPFENGKLLSIRNSCSKCFDPVNDKLPKPYCKVAVFVNSSKFVPCEFNTHSASNDSAFTSFVDIVCSKKPLYQNQVPYVSKPFGECGIVSQVLSSQITPSCSLQLNWMRDHRCMVTVSNSNNMNFIGNTKPNHATKIASSECGKTKLRGDCVENFHSKNSVHKTTLDKLANKSNNIMAEGTNSMRKVIPSTVNNKTFLSEVTDPYDLTQYPSAWPFRVKPTLLQTMQKMFSMQISNDRSKILKTHDNMVLTLEEEVD